MSSRSAQRPSESGSLICSLKVRLIDLSSQSPVVHRRPVESSCPLSSIRWVLTGYVGDPASATPHRLLYASLSACPCPPFARYITRSLFSPLSYRSAVLRPRKGVCADALCIVSSVYRRLARMESPRVCQLSAEKWATIRGH